MSTCREDQYLNRLAESINWKNAIVVGEYAGLGVCSLRVKPASGDETRRNYTMIIYRV